MAVRSVKEYEEIAAARAQVGAHRQREAALPQEVREIGCWRAASHLLVEHDLVLVVADDPVQAREAFGRVNARSHVHPGRVRHRNRKDVFVARRIEAAGQVDRGRAEVDAMISRNGAWRWRCRVRYRSRCRGDNRSRNWQTGRNNRRQQAPRDPLQPAHGPALPVASEDRTIWDPSRAVGLPATKVGPQAEAPSAARQRRALPAQRSMRR